MKRILIPLLAILAATSLLADGEQPPFITYSTKPLSQYQRARGQFGFQEHVYTNDVLNGVYGWGYGASAFGTTEDGNISLQAAENFTNTAHGTKIVFQTTPLTTAAEATSLTVTSTGLGLLNDAAPRTNLTPPAAGYLVWNSADKQLCVSTGTAVNSWVQVADGTTACSH